MATFREFWKNRPFTKPGASIHSAKFDRCVEHVKRSGSADNAYAVCMAVLGEDEAVHAGHRHKSEVAYETEEEMKSRIDDYLHKLGIEGAGPVPESLMARQDLEGTEKYGYDETNMYAGYPESTKGRNGPSDYDMDTNYETGYSGAAKHIRHEGGKWNLYSRKDGKLLGSHSTREGAVRQEQAIEANKGINDDIAEESTGEAHYRDLSDTYSDMADDEAQHKRNLQSMKSKEADTEDYKIEDDYHARDGQHQTNNWGGKSAHKSGSDHEMTIEIHNGSDWDSSSSEETVKAAFEGCSLPDLEEIEREEGVPIFAGPEMTDANGHRIGTFVVMGQDGTAQVFFDMFDAEQFVHSVFTARPARKALVSDAEKDLDKLTDSDMSKRTLVERITAYQEKRQKTALRARGVNKSFKDFWRTKRL